jgi:hypothetical protein
MSSDHAAWLERYTPVLRYHSQELYRAVSVEAFTDYHFDGGPGAARWTALKRAGEREPIADARPSAKLRLTSALLAPTYKGGRRAAKADFLDAHNLSHAADAAIVQLDERNRDVVYGTAIPRGDGRPGAWLQYWLFYTYNSKAALQTKLGVHEGDWEMIQVRVDGRGQAQEVTYAQHGYARRAPWSSRLVRKVDGHPVVYVALGSHASYFEAGRHPVQLPMIGGWLIDDVCDDGRQASTTLVAVDNAKPPPWARWPGRWGSSTTGEFKSPEGPAVRPRWRNPDEFHAKAEPAKPLEKPDEVGVHAYLPDVHVWQEGDRVHVTYRKPSEDHGLWTAELAIAVHERGSRPPREHVFDATGVGPPDPDQSSSR